MIAFFAAIALPAAAQDTLVWSDMACSESHIKVPAGVKCRATQEYSGGHALFSTGNGVFRQWSAFGTVNGAKLYYSLSEGIGIRSQIRDTESFDHVIRSLSPEGKSARNFSELKHAGGVDYMTFTSSKGDPCFGIHMYGSPVRGGFRWILRATRCEAGKRKITEEDVTRFVSETGYGAR